LKGYYDTLPSEIEEAARVDGAKPWQAFWRVLLPMADPDAGGGVHAGLHRRGD
jgi:ABC-type glycerol-3-phosphate transport system permease component